MILITTIFCYRFDRTVLELQSLETGGMFTGLMSEWKDCVVEMRGQLYLNAGVFLMKLGKEVRVCFTDKIFIVYNCSIHTFTFCVKQTYLFSKTLFILINKLSYMVVNSFWS
jgi:hypothetical protein